MSTSLTPNVGLKLVSSDDTVTTFLQWRTWMNGETESNMTILDTKIAELQVAINGKANSTHNHSTSDLTSGILPITRGGTGGVTAAAARTALGVPTIYSGTTDPSAQIGADGDIYLKLEA